MSKKTYRVRGIDLDHNGKRYSEGDTIELEQDEAAELSRWLESVAWVEPLALVDQQTLEKPAKSNDKGEGSKQ